MGPEKKTINFFMNNQFSEVDLKITTVNTCLELQKNFTF